MSYVSVPSFQGLSTIAQIVFFAGEIANLLANRSEMMPCGTKWAQHVAVDVRYRPRCSHGKTVSDRVTRVQGFWSIRFDGMQSRQR